MDLDELIKFKKLRQSKDRPIIELCIQLAINALCDKSDYKSTSSQDKRKYNEEIKLLKKFLRSRIKNSEVNRRCYDRHQIRRKEKASNV